MNRPLFDTIISLNDLNSIVKFLILDHPYRRIFNEKKKIDQYITKYKTNIRENLDECVQILTPHLLPTIMYSFTIRGLMSIPLLNLLLHKLQAYND